MEMTRPAGGNVNRGPTIKAILWTQGAISILVVALPFFARISIGAMGMDDWVMLFTLAKYDSRLSPSSREKCLPIFCPTAF